MREKQRLVFKGGRTQIQLTGKKGLTMAGLLMFGKGLSIRERFDNFRMDYIDFCNLISEERYSDRLTSSTPHWANKMGLQNLNRVKVRPLWANGIWPNG